MEDDEILASGPATLTYYSPALGRDVHVPVANFVFRGRVLRPLPEEGVTGSSGYASMTIPLKWSKHYGLLRLFYGIDAIGKWDQEFIEKQVRLRKIHHLYKRRRRFW